MSTKAFPFISPTQARMILRITVSVFLMAHGIIRIYLGTVGGFGEFLNSKGFLIGAMLAWFLTIFEIVGGAAMAMGYFIRWITAVFIIELFMGIILVHAQNGWFVVGASSGGMEYSVLLIVCLLVIASQSRE